MTGPSPPALLPSLQGVPLVCPLCRREPEATAEGFACGRCRRTYPVVEGIPDFRIFADPFLDVEADYLRARKVIDALDRHDLRALLEYYWSLSDTTPELLRPHFVRSALRSEAKARRLLRLVDDGEGRGAAAPARVLEVGSGTGGFLAVAASSPRFPRVVGVDIAMRWLHLSRRRFMDLGVPVPALVCACAERLPFPDGWFDLTVMVATLEFTRDAQQALAECERVLRPGGALVLNTVNRFSVAREPHVRLWGVGLLPRRWQLAYVRWRRGVDFSRVRPVSRRELLRLAGVFRGRPEFVPADVPDETLAELSRSERLQVSVYRRLKRLRLLRPLVVRFGPEWDVKLTKPGSAGTEAIH